MCKIIKEIKTENNYDFSGVSNNEIEEFANRILNNFKIDTYPVPIVTIAEKIGFKCFGAFLKKNISGVVKIDANLIEDYYTDKVILINVKENPGHRKFTIAHELGHYLFDFNETQKTAYLNAYDLSEDSQNSEEEQRANRFAAALLMPSTEFINQFQKLKNKNYTKFEIVVELTQHFFVSRTAIEKRVEELGLEY